MFCRICGKQLENQELVCGQCGTPVKRPAAENTQEEATELVTELVSEAVPPSPEEYQTAAALKPEPEPEEKTGNKVLMGILIAAIVIVLMAGGAFFVWIRFLQPAKDTGGGTPVVSTEETLEPETDDMETEATLAEGETAEESQALMPEGLLSDRELAQRIAAYNAQGASAVVCDVYAENYSPGTRNINDTWNRSLFYTLEDVDPASAADGMINGYDITRKMLNNAATGNKMEYEIYTNPATGKVNKIVSIEYMDEYLEITDYYYNDAEQVSFVFIRNDINYIPSYAVPTTDGQRFYFNNDCMTKWRVVNNGVQTNYVVGPEAAKDGGHAGSSIFEYSGLETGAKTNYDLTEKRMINAAYNTYHTVLDAEGISEITGYVYDEDGAAVPEASVVLVSDSDEKLYEVKTDSTGMYRIVVPSEENSYRLLVTSADCVDAIVYGVNTSQQMLSDYHDAVYMVDKTNADQQIQVQVYDALNYAADGQGMERLSEAAVYIRDGVNHRDGGVVAQGTADADGMVRAELPPGMYTAEVVKDGYDNTYYNFAVRDDMDTVQINASPKLAEGEVRIVLTWTDTPRDLDSHLFTPYDSVFGDSTYHIWFGNRYDAVGNNLDVDDTDGYGPETMTIPLLKNGLYKYYVADYTNCSSANPTSLEMSNSGAMVNVYTSNGLNSTFMVPSNRPGAIWEVFEIRNGAIVPSQRYYTNIEDKSWWHNDK